MYDAPIMMYGPRGWADLNDYRLVRSKEEAEAAARDGYFRAGEDARRDLIAEGEWTSEQPRRRGRPPKVAQNG
jgi:hypothetical protein